MPASSLENYALYLYLKWGASTRLFREEDIVLQEGWE